MSVEWTFTVAGGSILLVAALYGLHMLDERKWARDVKRRAEWERTHTAE